MTFHSDMSGLHLIQWVKQSKLKKNKGLRERHMVSHYAYCYLIVGLYDYFRIYDYDNLVKLIIIVLTRGTSHQTSWCLRNIDIIYKIFKIIQQQATRVVKKGRSSCIDISWSN